MKIKKLSEHAKIPTKNNETDAGYDLSSIISTTILPNERKLIPIGIAIDVPIGCFGSVRDRSGLAVKKGIHTMAGVIDSGYHGEVCVVLINLGNEPFEINVGDRIAQLIIQPIYNPRFEEVDSFDSSERGEKGFGSSGV